ncbi:DUF3995 domain-containing protein [Cytophagaceae bacterium ABcell3]|nr:DUF3995 domain-containing protein [Cytophagaceae bacterium ABcell3]
MVIIIAVILCLVFLFLASLHIYWAVGGKWGSDAVLPTKDNRTKAIMPGPLPTFAVAFGLLCFGFIILNSVFELGVQFPLWLDVIFRKSIWGIVVIFLLRAVGDFRYVGFYKKYKNTPFGKMDTKYYSPLCLGISLLTMAIALFK